MTKKDEKTDAHETLDVNVESSTRTIKAQFRRKAKALNSDRAQNPVSKKSFEELNEAYQELMQRRKKGQELPKKTVTVLSSDVAGYSLMMANHEAETLEFFNFCKEIFEEMVENNQGRIFNTAGDAILAEFDHVFSAIQCAVEIQKELRAVNLGQPEGMRIQFRMGINMGEVFVQEGDLFGDTVNIAARIQTAAKPGGICLSGEIHKLVANKVAHTFTSLGKLTFKNIPEPIATYALVEDDGTFKAPIRDTKVLSNAAVPLAEKAKTKTKKKETSSGLGSGLMLAAVMAVAAGGYYFTQSRDSAKSPESKLPVAPVAMGQLFFAPTPDSKVTLTLSGKVAFSGQTPAQLELKPGRYTLLIENKNLDIPEETELQVMAGPNPRYQKIFLAKKSTTTVVDQYAIDGTGASSSSSPSTGPLSQVELDQKQSADQSKDPQSAYLFGLSSLKRGTAEVAYHYLVIASLNNHGPAQLELGKMYFSRQGTPSTELSFDASFYWLLKSALNGVKDATAFLATNSTKFPQEYSRQILNQRRIDNHEARAAQLQEEQLSFLVDLKQKINDAGLPN